MPDGIFLITGGNAGIGKAIAIALAEQGRRVAIVSRDPGKGAAALAEIRARAANGAAAELVVGDLGTIAGARQVAATARERFPRLAALINNAGVWQTSRVITADGLELSFMVNHLAPFILSTRLLWEAGAAPDGGSARSPLAGAPARIVNVNAGLYVKGRLDLEKTPYGRDFGKFATYANTKLCNTLFTVELARRLDGSGPTANAVHPGVIRTNLGAAPGLLGRLLALAKRFWKAPAEGARGPVWLATAPEAAGFNGRYFDETRPIALAPAAEDRDLARRLWERSEELAGGN